MVIQILKDHKYFLFQNLNFHDFSMIFPSKWNSMIFPYQGDFFHIFHDFPDLSLMVGSLFLWYCPQMNSTRPNWWLVNIGSGNGLLPQQAITWFNVDPGCICRHMAVKFVTNILHCTDSRQDICDHHIHVQRLTILRVCTAYRKLSAHRFHDQSYSDIQSRMSHLTQTINQGRCSI